MPASDSRKSHARKRNIIQAIKNGLPAALRKDKLKSLTRRAEKPDRATLDYGEENLR